MSEIKDVRIQKSFTEQLRQNMRFYRSPVSFFLLLAFTTGNFIVSTSISSMTSIVATKVKQGFEMCSYCDSFCPEDVGSDRMCRITESTVNQQITGGLDIAMIKKHLEAQQYETIINEFSTMRSIISGVFCIVFGLLVDILRRRLYKSPSSEILVLVVPYVLIVTCFAIFSIFILSNNFVFFWMALIALSINSSWVFLFYTMAVELCFPGDSIGIIFAVIELIGGISTWIFSELVIQNFSFGKFSYSMITASIVSGLGVYFLISLSLDGPSCITNFDADRKRALNAARGETRNSFQMHKTNLPR